MSSTTLLQDIVHRESIENPEKFWMAQADHLHWHKKPTRALSMTTKKLPSGVEHPTWEWFPDGEISTCYNQVDRHVLAGHGDSPAIYYDSPASDTKRCITYKELLSEVETLAGVLRESGVQKGDVVLCYSESLSGCSSERLRNGPACRAPRRRRLPTLRVHRPSHHRQLCGDSPLRNMTSRRQNKR